MKLDPWVLVHKGERPDLNGIRAVLRVVSDLVVVFIMIRW